MSFFDSLPLNDCWESLLPDQISLQRAQHRIIFLSCTFVLGLFVQCRTLCRSWNQLTLDRRIQHICRAVTLVVSLGISARLAFGNLFEARIMMGLLHMIFLAGLPALRTMFDGVGITSLPTFFRVRLTILIFFCLNSLFLCGNISWKALLLYLPGLCLYFIRLLWNSRQCWAATQQVRSLSDGAWWPAYVVQLLTDVLYHILKRWWRNTRSDLQVLAGTTSLPWTTIGASSTASFNRSSMPTAWDEPGRDPVNESDEQRTAEIEHTHEVEGSSTSQEEAMNAAPSGLDIEQPGDRVLETGEVACRQPWDLISAHTINSAGSCTADLPNLICDGLFPVRDPSHVSTQSFNSSLVSGPVMRGKIIHWSKEAHRFFSNAFTELGADVRHSILESVGELYFQIEFQGQRLYEPGDEDYDWYIGVVKEADRSPTKLLKWICDSIDPERSAKTQWLAFSIASVFGRLLCEDIGSSSYITAANPFAEPYEAATTTDSTVASSMELW